MSISKGDCMMKLQEIGILPKELVYDFALPQSWADKHEDHGEFVWSYGADDSKEFPRQCMGIPLNIVSLYRENFPLIIALELKRMFDPQLEGIEIAEIQAIIDYLKI